MNRRVLSLWQPWASFLVLIDPMTGRPPKQWETRHWRPKQSLPIDVVIHATQKFEGAILNVPHVTELHRRLGPVEMPRGAIIGVATIWSIVPTDFIDAPDDYDETHAHVERALGDYSPGRFAWFIKGAGALAQPIPFKGRQDALYLLDDPTQALVDEQLVGAPI